MLQRTIGSIHLWMGLITFFVPHYQTWINKLPLDIMDRLCESCSYQFCTLLEVIGFIWKAMTVQFGLITWSLTRVCRQPDWSSAEAEAGVWRQHRSRRGDLPGLSAQSARQHQWVQNAPSVSHNSFGHFLKLSQTEMRVQKIICSFSPWNCVWLF